MAHCDRSDTCPALLKEENTYKKNLPKRKGGDRQVQVSKRQEKQRNVLVTAK